MKNYFCVRVYSLGNVFSENGAFREDWLRQQAGSIAFTDALAFRKLSDRLRSFGRSEGRLMQSDGVCFLPGGGHALPVLHCGHLVHVLGDVENHEVSLIVAITALMENITLWSSAGPSAQA